MCVTAVVVTYNRAEKLAKVLEHLRGQTRQVDRLVIVDNASTDDTARLLGEAAVADERFVVHRMPKNLGGAGGFAHGIAAAYADGADAVWIMDDDCYPRPDTLQKLLEGHRRAETVLGEPVSFAGSMVTWTDGSICAMNAFPADNDWGELIARGERLTLVQYGSFVSLLVPRWAIEQVGLPLAEYFIWHDDVEYTHRLRAAGKAVQVHDSVAVHDLPSNDAANAGTLTAENLWKFRHGMRNESSFLWHHKDAYRWIEFVLLTVVRMHRGGVPWRYRLAVVRAIVAGLRFDPEPRLVPLRGEFDPSAAGPVAQPDVAAR